MIKQKNIMFLSKKKIIGAVVALAISGTTCMAYDKIYAVVNGDNITQQTIAIALKDPKVKFDTLPEETRKNILDRIIEQKLLAQKAITTDAVNDDSYKQTLKSLKQDLALQVWLQRISKEIKISKNELKSFYDKNKKLFKVPAQLKAKHILVSTQKEAEELIEILNKSNNLKSKFIKLAKEKSTGPSGKDGGELGWFALDKMVPEFSSAANNLKVGTITKTAVKTQFGFHIIYLEDRKKESTAKFENAQFQISQQISKEKFIKHVQAIVDDLKKKAKITYK